MVKLPKYCHFKARNLGFVTYQTKRYYLPGPYGSEESKKAYQEFCDRISLADIENRNGRKIKIPERVRNSSVAGLLVGFLEHAENYYTGDTQTYNMFRYAARPVNLLYGRMPANEFGPLALKAVRDQMIKGGWLHFSGVPAKPWARKYVNRQVSRIVQIFRWGVENEIVAADVLKSLEAVQALRAGKSNARETRDVEPAKWNDVVAIKPYISPMLWDLIQLHWLTGMRSGELVRMRPCEIEQVEVDGWVYRPPDHKNAWRGKPKSICLGPRCIKILQKWIDGAENYIFTPEKAAALRGEKQPVAPIGRAKGEKFRPRYTSESYRKALRSGFRRMEADPEYEGEVVRWHPHQLRHSLATQVREQYGTEAASALLGNSLQATQIYAERSLKLGLQVAKEIA